MKQLLICAMAGLLVACSGGGGEVTVESAAKMSPMKLTERIIADMREGAELLDTVQTVEDAQSIKADLAEIGGRYRTQMDAARTVDPSKVKDPEALMQKRMESADALSQFMMSMANLRSRNGEAAMAINDEMGLFRPG